MVQRKRRATRKTARKTTRRTTTKSKVRRKKGVKRLASKAMISPAQKKKLHQSMKNFEQQINLLVRKYNQIWNTLKKF